MPMYCPNPFKADGISQLQLLANSSPLATLIVNSADGISANHIPFILNESDTNNLRLQAHIARPNPLSETPPSTSCLAIFHGPNGYISPNWYATKHENGKAVPTWNYSVVHVHGTLNIIDNAAWVEQQIEKLTQLNEKAQPKPWELAELPADFKQLMIKHIVGVEITIERIEVKVKANQNQPSKNQQSVLAALKDDPQQAAFYEMMAQALDAPAGKS